MNKHLSIFYFSILILCMSFVPGYVLAQGTPPVTAVIPCGEVGADGKLDECNFADLMKLVENVMDYLVKYVVIPAATISIAYAGFKIMMSQDNAGERSKAKTMLIKVVTGLIVLLAAWLLVKTVLGVFLKQEVIDTIPIDL